MDVLDYVSARITHVDLPTTFKLLQNNMHCLGIAVYNLIVSIVETVCRRVEDKSI